MSELNEKEQEITNLIGELAGEDVDAALELATGIFVGMLTAYMEFKGEDPNVETVITGSGPGQRRITLHAKK